MIVYKVVLGNISHEFDSITDAQAFCLSESLDFENIQEIEKQAPEQRLRLKDVSARQLRQAIVLSGMTLAQVDAILDSLDEPNKSLAKIAWEFEVKFSRNDELVDFIGASIGITSQQIDDLWGLAGTL